MVGDRTPTVTLTRAAEAFSGFMPARRSLYAARAAIFRTTPVTRRRAAHAATSYMYEAKHYRHARAVGWLAFGSAVRLCVWRVVGLDI